MLDIVLVLIAIVVVAAACCGWRLKPAGGRWRGRLLHGMDEQAYQAWVLLGGSPPGWLGGCKWAVAWAALARPAPACRQAILDGCTGDGPRLR